MSLLFSAPRNPYCMSPLFYLQTLNLIRFYLISPGFKYTFMPNLAIAWEVREKGIWNISTGTTLGCSPKISVQGPTVLHMLSTKWTGCERNLCLMWPLAVLSLVIIIKEPLSEPTHKLYYYSFFMKYFILWQTQGRM